MNSPIVLDNGSGLIKVGFSGGETPRSIFRNAIGRTKYVRVMPGGCLEGSDIFIGPKVEEHRGSLVTSYPVEHGVVQNWDDMEKVWTYMYSKEQLSVTSSEHPVLITEPPLNPRATKSKTAEIFFESFNIPAVHFAVQSILSLYSSGRTTGVVLDSGDGVTHAVPVYEGFALPHAISRLDIAGRDVTAYLQLLLRRSGHNFVSSAEFEIVREIKEASSFIQLDSTTKRKDPPKGVYVLPDGRSIDLLPELSQAPEVLFRPYIIGHEDQGVHDCLVKSIMKADVDIRRQLFSQVVLSGGNTLIPGFGERLLHEVRKHSLTPVETKIRIAAPPDRLYTTWIGGSILSSLSTFRSMWISKKDYMEQGERVFRTQDIF